MTLRNGIASCRNCGYKIKADEEMILKERYDHSHDKMIVADGKRIQGRLHSVLCPKCGSSVSILVNPRKRTYKCSLCGNIFSENGSFT